MQIARLHFSTLDSTNTWPKQHAQELERDKLTVISASQQTAGRGRLNHVWFSPPNQNMHLSYAFFLQERNPVLGNIPQVLALTAAQILTGYNVAPKIKWPNDLLIGEKKLGGILCEVCQLPDALLVIVGMGINVNMPAEELQKIERPATSILFETGQQHDLSALIDALSSAFAQDLEILCSQGFKPFHHALLRSFAIELKPLCGFTTIRQFVVASLKESTPMDRSPCS